MTTLCLTAALAGPAAAGKELPFQGSLQGVENDEFEPTTIVVNGSGSGNATQLGRFAVTWEFVVELPGLVSVGSAVFTAANGDSILTDAFGSAASQIGDLLQLSETYHIIGGTGRFAGATGSFELERTLDGEGFSSGSFQGAMVLAHGD